MFYCFVLFGEKKNTWKLLISLLSTFYNPFHFWDITYDILPGLCFADEKVCNILGGLYFVENVKVHEGSGI